MAVPTSWYEGEHLLARLRAHDVPQSDSAWCVVSGHMWSEYYPDAMPLPSWKPEPVCIETVKATRRCIRCDAAQDYQGNMIVREKVDA